MPFVKNRFQNQAEFCNIFITYKKIDHVREIFWLTKVWIGLFNS